MAELLIYFLLAYGTCNILIFANGPFHVFKKMHECFQKHMPIMEEMMTCFICLPTWFGIFMSTVNVLALGGMPLTPMTMLGMDYELWFLTILFDGLATSGGCWLIHTTQEALERSGGGTDD